jgi:hypothetical protein
MAVLQAVLKAQSATAAAITDFIEKTATFAPGLRDIDQ